MLANHALFSALLLVRWLWNDEMKTCSLRDDRHTCYTGYHIMLMLGCCCLRLLRAQLRTRVGIAIQYALCLQYCCCDCISTLPEPVLQRRVDPLSGGGVSVIHSTAHQCVGLLFAARRAPPQNVVDYAAYG